VIPGEVHIGGTTRTTTAANRALAQKRIKEICDGAAQMYGVAGRGRAPAGLSADSQQSGGRPSSRWAWRPRCAAPAACATTSSPAGAEDSPTCWRVPGAMVMLGKRRHRTVNLPTALRLHDMAIPFGISFFVKTVERFLGDQKA